MQHFRIDDLPPADQITVRKFYRRMGFGYAGVILLGLVFALSRNPNPDVGKQVAARQGTAPVNGLFSAVASEAPNRTVCAERDLKVISLLNEHGDVQDIPADDLRKAFFALLDARKACSSGRVEDALAIYERVTFTSGKSAQRQ